jgi:hypothetical protein
VPTAVTEVAFPSIPSLAPSNDSGSRYQLPSPETMRPPFQTRLLEFEAQRLPATRRTGVDDIIPAEADLSLLEQELLVRRLNSVQRWLFWCGRPMPPRPLHHQVLISRAIAVTERVDLHMLWSRNRIFIKPLPSFLLDPNFWVAHLLPPSPAAPGSQIVAGSATRNELHGCALGLLFSYTALIMYETDFRLAQEHGLLPRSITWLAWRTLCSEFLSDFSYSAINPRYWYGELRLARLNMIYRIKNRSLWRAYSQVDHPSVYGSFLQDHFGSLAAALAFVAIVLTAMQVGLETEALQQSWAFQEASYVFTVFSILAPIAGAFALAGFVCVLALMDLRTTAKYAEARFRDMGVS